MNIAFTYNVRRAAPDADDPRYLAEAEFDTPETIAGITLALESLGHRVFPVEADELAYEKLRALKGAVDLVFNFAEGLHGADREAQLPAMLEMLQIPYTGPQPLSYALGLHKAKAKEVMSYYGIPTPRWLTVSGTQDLVRQAVEWLPAIVKPLAEGSSKGIYAKNLVRTPDELAERVAEIIAGGREALIEEFLPGREFTVGIIGTPPRALPIVEIKFDTLPPGLPQFDHFEAKWLYDNPAAGCDPLVCPAAINAELEYRIKEICLRAFRVLAMADWARLDVRLDALGIPNVIEINCPPGLIPNPQENSRLPRAGRAAGLSFAAIIEKVLQSCCQRYGLAYYSTVGAALPAPVWQREPAYALAVRRPGL